MHIHKNLVGLSFISTATIKINPDTSLANNASFYIKIANTAFADLAGNPFAGITDKTTWNFATVDTTLTYPLNTWQRFWYTTSGASPSFIDSNFLGETPNESVEKFTNDWDGDSTIIAYGKSNNIGFQSSRTIYFQTAGNYRFTINSDDGSRLNIDEGAWEIEQWENGGNNTKFVDVNISQGNHKFQLDYYENTGSAKVSFDYALACAKTNIKPTSTINVTVKTATSTKQCPVQLLHFGGDATDGGAVKYEVISQPAGQITIGMDDAPPGQGNCDNDLIWETEWEDPVGARNLRVHTRIGGHNTGHDLFYGYQILTDVAQRGCVIDANVLQQPCDGNFCVTNIQTPIASASSWWIGTVQAAAQCFTQNYCPSHASLGDRYAVVQGNYGSDQSELRATGWMYDYNVVECISNSQCDPSNADANLDKDYSNIAKCNLNPAITYAPQNTCIDSVVPAITIGEIKRTSPDPKVITNNWLKGGIYEISVSVTDNVGGSGVDAAYRPVTIRSIGADNIFGPNPITGIDDDRVYSTTRTAENKFSVWVGSPDSLANDCVKEGPAQCRIEVYARDAAGNDTVLSPFPLLNIDYTAPSAQ